jgi:hypothetical protein
MLAHPGYYCDAATNRVGHGHRLIQTDTSPRFRFFFKSKSKDKTAAPRFPPKMANGLGSCTNRAACSTFHLT